MLVSRDRAECAINFSDVVDPLQLHVSEDSTNTLTVINKIGKFGFEGSAFTFVILAVGRLSAEKRNAILVPHL